MPSRNGNISFPVHRLYCRFSFLFPFLRVEIGGKYSTAAASQRVDSRAQQNSRENIRSVKEVGTLGSSLEYGEGKKECRIKTLYIPMKNRSGLSGRQDGDCFMGTYSASTGSSCAPNICSWLWVCVCERAAKVSAVVGERYLHHPWVSSSVWKTAQAGAEKSRKARKNYVRVDRK